MAPREAELTMAVDPGLTLVLKVTRAVSLTLGVGLTGLPEESAVDLMGTLDSAPESSTAKVLEAMVVEV